jgi:hypothetical protein
MDEKEKDIESLNTPVDPNDASDADLEDVSGGGGFAGSCGTNSCGTFT